MLTRTHTNTHLHKHTHTRTDTHIRYANVHHTNAHNAPTLSHMHTHVHSCTLLHTHIHIRTNLHICTHSQTHIHKHTHACTHVCTHPHTHTNVRKYEHSHIYTLYNGIHNNLVLISNFWQWCSSKAVVLLCWHHLCIATRFISCYIVTASFLSTLASLSPI